jgi:hypothetical protein
MTTASLRRPEWAASGTFSAAWTAAHDSYRFGNFDSARRFNETIVRALGYAHVIAIDAAQVEAIPALPDYGAAASTFASLRLPFDPVYISVDRVPMRNYTPPEGKLLGALVGTNLIDLAETDPDHHPAGPVVAPCLTARTGRAGALSDTFMSMAWPCTTEPGWWTTQCVSERDLRDAARRIGLQLTDKDISDYKSVAGDAANIITRVLYLLESTNVELVEVPVPRQQRRAAQRAGGQVALTVRVRPPRRAVRHDVVPSYRDWTHRWEVRGHYKHFRTGTIYDAHPDRRVPTADGGDCVRVWCPPHVKGPQDKVLVPKVRVVETATGAP